MFVLYKMRGKKLNMEKIANIIKKYEFFYNVLLIMSIITFNLSITLSNMKEYTLFIMFFQISMIIGLCIYLLFYKHWLIKILSLKENNFNLYLSAFLALETSKIVMDNSTKCTFLIDEIVFKINKLTQLNIDKLYFIEKIGAFILMLPFLLVIWYLLITILIPHVKKFIKSLSNLEKKYLIVASIIITIFIFMVNISTNAFSYSIIKNTNSFIEYDVIYTTDSGTQISMDSYTNFSAPENDLRQPLFALFSFPFGMFAKIGTNLFSFLPAKIVYPFFISILQMFCLLICSILICRLINKKTSILNLVCYLLMFPTILFMLNIEQYVFGLFWLIILVYYFIENNSSNPILFSATTGSLLTNGIFLPFIVFNKDIKKFIKSIFKYLIVFAILIIVFGKTYSVIYEMLNYSRFTRFMGTGLTFRDKLLQYINFISSCFIAPASHIKLNYGIPKHASYQLCEVTTINALGVILIGLMIMSFVINYKKKIAKISFGWLIFSFLILVIIGWGTEENGLIIYGIYFSWAYFILIVLLLNQLLLKMPKLKNIIWCLIFFALITINGKELINIIRFGINYYPFIL